MQKKNGLATKAVFRIHGVNDAGLFAAVIFQATIIIAVAVTPVFRAGILPIATAVSAMAVIGALALFIIIFALFIASLVARFTACTEIVVGLKTVAPSQASAKARAVTPAIAADEILLYAVTAVIMLNGLK